MSNNPLAKLSIPQLRRVVAIREQIEGLEKEMTRLAGGRPPSARAIPPLRKGKPSAAARARMSAGAKSRWARVKGPKPPASRRRKPSPPGHLKEQIIGTLKAAGKTGTTIKELSAKLGTSYGNISVWFRTTGKRVKEIKKIAPARFAWK